MLLRTEYTRLADKTKLPPGPWQDEPDKVVWVDEKTALDCMINRNRNGAWCGYVGLPQDHPWFEKDYDNLDVYVHGGLTFSEHCIGDEVHPEWGICHVHQPGRPGNVWWIGFDCSHYMDVTPGFIDQSPFEGTVYRDIDYVTAEVQALAAQAQEAASGTV